MASIAAPNTAAPIVAESELTYTPPAESDESVAFDKSLNDVISEIEGEFQDNKYEFTDEELAADDQEPEAKGDPDDGGETSEATEAPEVARGMERLVAREVALQAKEAEFQRRESRVGELEAELGKLRAAVPTKKLLEDLENSPSAAFKAAGLDPDAAVKLMIAEQLEEAGKEVPEELKKFVERTKGERRVRELERKIAEQERAAVAAQTFNAVQLGAREYVKTMAGDSKNLPTLAEIAKSNPDHAHLEIMEEIQVDARARMAADPNGEPITFAEAAKRVEARLAKLKAMFNIGPASTSTNGAQKPASEARKTPPQAKPPVAPLKPWQKKDDNLYEDAIKEAEREFYKEEARARRR